MEILDLNTVNVELSKIVLSVAEELDNRYCDCLRVRAPVINYKVVVDGYEIVIDGSKLLEEEREEREKTKKQIKRLINHDAATGYIKAFELCGDIDNKDTRKIKYHACSKIPYISLQKRIDISKKYIEIDHERELSTLREIITWEYEMIKNKEAFESKIIYQDFRRLCILSKAHHQRWIVWFYSNKKAQDGIDYWEKILFHALESSPTEDTEILWEILCDLLVEKKEYDVIETYIYQSESIGLWGKKLFDMLIKIGEFDRAETLLNNWEKCEINTTEPDELIFNDKLNFIESNRQRLPFMREGIVFWSAYESVVGYDKLNIYGNKKEVARIKYKYKEVIYQLRELRTLKYVCSYYDEYSNKYVNVCEEIVSIFPQLQSYITEIRKHASYDDRYEKVPCDGIFKELAMYYQKRNMLHEAIKVCEKAIEYGCVEDGTKSGMHGRLQRLQKKLNK